MKADLAPIINDSERLLREVVITAAKMPKDYKWMVGAKMRDDAISSLLLAQKAFRSARKPIVALPLLNQLADFNDSIQALLQVGYDVNAIPSIGRLKELSELTKRIGRQCGGWINAFNDKHPNGQNPASSAPPERPGTLSTRGASSEAQ